MEGSWNFFVANAWNWPSSSLEKPLRGFIATMATYICRGRINPPEGSCECKLGAKKSAAQLLYWCCLIFAVYYRWYGGQRLGSIVGWRSLLLATKAPRSVRIARSEAIWFNYTANTSDVNLDSTGIVLRMTSVRSARNVALFDAITIRMLIWLGGGLIWAPQDQ